MDVEAAWARVLSDPRDPEPHRRFLEAAMRGEKLALAASRYGKLAKDLPDIELVRKQLDHVVALMGFAIQGPRPPRRDGSPLTGTKLLLGAFVLAGFVLAAFAAIVAWQR
ncbi:MAG: hypothetical protein HC923_12435 [Myxococcales bacterium]|nr:hypothetical protein [Myxococcales bacterium]